MDMLIDERIEKQFRVRQLEKEIKELKKEKNNNLLENELIINQMKKELEIKEQNYISKCLEIEELKKQDFKIGKHIRNETQTTLTSLENE
jgi:hypothetical protein